MIAIFISRWELKSLEHAHDITATGENLIGKNSWEWQRDHKTLGRIQPRVCFITIHFKTWQIFIFSSAGRPGWTRFCIVELFMWILSGENNNNNNKSPANTQKFCHPIYYRGFCLWDVACFLNSFLIFLGMTESHCQQTKAEWCCWYMSLPCIACNSFPPLLYCIRSIRLKFW